MITNIRRRRLLFYLTDVLQMNMCCDVIIFIYLFIYLHLIWDTQRSCTVRTVSCKLFLDCVTAVCKLKLTWLVCYERWSYYTVCQRMTTVQNWHGLPIAYMRNRFRSCNKSTANPKNGTAALFWGTNYFKPISHTHNLYHRSYHTTLLWQGVRNKISVLRRSLRF